MSIFQRWGVKPIINACGAVTRLGGAPMPPAVLDAFREAALESVPLDQLHAAASRQISAVTRAEAGIVTSGCAAALTLGTAAILAGFDLAKMEKLPRCKGFKHEFIVAREHRNGYDHAVRAAGAKLVEVGFNEIVAGAGVRRTEAWEYEAAIGPNTAGIFYVLDPHSQPKLEEVVKVAQRYGKPILVDAAGELPPRSNLQSIVGTGADLVAFSGGKAIRGPQATGLLCGRVELVMSALIQMLDMDDHFEFWEPPFGYIHKANFPGLPRHGIGRGFKVSKEQIVAQLTALELFSNGAYDSEVPLAQARLERIVNALTGVACRLIASPDGETLPSLEITVSLQGRSAWDVCRSLRQGDPPVYVGHGLLDQGKLLINPLHLNDERTAALIRRLTEELV